SGDIDIDNTGDAQIQEGVVTTTEIFDGTIATVDIATGAVTTTEILDETILAEDIATGAVTTTEILDGTIANEDLDKANIPLSGFGAATANLDLGSFQINNLADPTANQDAATKIYVDNSIDANDDLAQGNIWVGDASGNQSAVAAFTDGNMLIGDGTTLNSVDISGDIDIDNTGDAQIQEGVIINADINVAAAIDATKISNGNVTNTEFDYLDGVTSALQTQLDGKISQSLPSGNILIGNGTGTATARDITGDVTISNTGVTTIGSDKVTNDMLAGSIDLTSKVTNVLPVANGGTGATDAATAQTNLGLTIGSEVQAYDAGLTSIASLTTAADEMIYTTGPDVYAVTSLTAAGRALLDDSDAAAQRTTLGLGNVDNTSDADKPISTATQTALDLKAPLASPNLTGTPLAPTAAAGTNTTQIATTEFVTTAVNNAKNEQTAADVDFTAYGNIEATDVKTAIQELDDEKLALAGGTMTGAINMNSNAITNADAITGTTITATTLTDGTASISGGNITTNGSILATGNSGGVGYSSGGSDSQASLKIDGVTINALSGQITTSSSLLNSISSGSGERATFTVTNSLVSSTDVPLVSVANGNTNHVIFVSRVAEGEFDITILNATMNNLSEELIINFVIIKAANN
ncbi:beta strand repeat-containing protein, partial [Vibrio sp.]|uniref:beta strand repeat-containing protein n=1 Tax=Vibrio sp. TaxID=678 RepID=UPI003D10F1C6